MNDELEKMSKMSDEELARYIQEAEDAFSNYVEPAPVKGQPEVPKPSIEEPKQIIPVKEETKKPSRDMVPTLQEINNRLESFLQKADQIIDIANRFEKWGSAQERKIP